MEDPIAVVPTPGGEQVRKMTQFTTPNGNPAHFTWRLLPETTDWNTITSCLTEDEYGLKGLHFTGWALDIGAHIGSVAIALLIDNPELNVIAVEPIPENVDLIEENAKRNGVSDRLIVVPGAADAPGVESVQITWNYEGGETIAARGHRFIGNVSFSQSDHSIKHDELVCAAYSLEQLFEIARADRFSFAKIDCEGCEARFFLDGNTYRIDRIHGEWHPPHASVETMRYMLRGFDLDIWGPGEEKEVGYGRGFVAVRR